MGGDLVQLRRNSSSAIQAHMLVGKSCRGIFRVVYLFKIQRHYLKEITYIKVNLTAKFAYIGMPSINLNISFYDTAWLTEVKLNKEHLLNKATYGSGA